MTAAASVGAGGFDRIIAVDGSAASAPKRGADSIWLSVDRLGSVDEPENLPTRSAMVARLLELCAEPGRSLVAVDWSLGFPAGSATAFRLRHADRAPWAAWWAHLADEVHDDVENRNDRFRVAGELNRRTPAPGPFWGAPSSAASDVLTVTKQPFVDVDEWRGAERRLRSDRRWPKSCWQLGGAGSVGGQTLLGIARLAELRRRLPDDVVSAVWPFETGLRPASDDVRVVIAEMWPTLFVSSAELPPHWIRDAAQVDASVRRLRSAERSGDLAAWFAPRVEDEATVVGEEGWVLGLA